MKGLVLQSSGGFEPYYLGFFKALQEENVKNQIKAISCVGSSITPALSFSSSLPLSLEKYLEQIIELNKPFGWFGTKEAVSLGMTWNYFFHNLTPFEYWKNFWFNKTNTLYVPNIRLEERDELLKDMLDTLELDVYSSLVNYETGQERLCNLKDIDIELLICFGIRIPYFKPKKAEGQVWIENYYKNPILTPLIDDEDIDELLIIKLFPEARVYTEDFKSGTQELINNDFEIMNNIYLNNEVKMINKINTWIENGWLNEELSQKYKTIKVNTIEDFVPRDEYFDYSEDSIRSKYRKGYLEGKRVTELYFT